MTTDNTIKRAEAVVTQAEADHILALTRQEGITMKTDPNEARRLGHEISREVHRVYDKLIYDEEEVRLFNLSKKK